MNRVFVYSRGMFKRNLLNAGVNDGNVEGFDSFAFISIQSTQAIESGVEPFFKEAHSNVLLLVFDDLTDKDQNILEEYPGSRLFDVDDAKMVIDFVEAHKDRKFCVHCTAGISRSGAVGEYIRRELGISYDDYIKDNTSVFPNSYVLRVLSETKDGMAK